MKKLINFFKEEEGASMVEYGLLVALVAIIAMVTLSAIGTNLATLFTTVANKLK